MHVVVTSFFLSQTWFAVVLLFGVVGLTACTPPDTFAVPEPAREALCCAAAPWNRVLK